MKKIIFIMIVAGVVSWIGYDFFSSTNTDGEENGVDNKMTAQPSNQQAEEEVVESDEIGLEVGQIAPDFELEALDGGTVKLSDLRGERVMINFWATWCPPCRAEMPDMQRFHEDTDIKILAVNLIETESSFDNVPAFLDELGLTFPVLLDEGSELSTAYQIVAYPTTFMVDGDGRIQYKMLGAINYDIMIQEYEKMG